VDILREFGQVQDRESFERELNSFRTYLLFVACRLKERGLAGPEAASDLVARTFLAAIEKVRAGNIPGADERHRKAWLRKILIRTTKRIRRTGQAEVHGGGRLILELDRPIPDTATTPAQIAVKDEERMILADAFAALEPSDQEIIRWRYVDQLSWEEIAKRRGFSAPYACRIGRQALERLRNAVRPDSDSR
jgi:RNA polymerase sigma factor (sigma-70 family)